MLDALEREDDDALCEELGESRSPISSSMAAGSWRSIASSSSAVSLRRST